MPTLRFRLLNKDIFDAIRSKKKKIETRAATPRYQKIKKGEIITFICGKDTFEKRIKKVEHFSSIRKLVEKYPPKEINPNVKSENELREIYNSFPKYSEKIKKYGICAWSLEE